MKEYYKYEIEDVLKELVTKEEGLSSKEVVDRLNKYGPNELPKGKKKNAFQIFVEQFRSPIVYIMFIAGILSIIGKEYVDAIAIMFIVLVDAIVGTIQEFQASKEAESLQKLIQVKCKVIRDGKEKLVNSEELVIGDIIVLESGNKISADARIISSLNLNIDESILTGESLPREKNGLKITEDKSVQDIDNMLYAGTSVVKGRCMAVVVATGADTEIGKISSKVIDDENEKTPLTIRMEKLTKQITVMIVVIAIILTILMVVKGTDITTVFTSVVALSVSALPEGLPLALTLALTIGSYRMSEKNVIVKKLNAVESLGSCTVIASDKTGTLTVNEQTAKKIVLPGGKSFDIDGSGYNGIGKVHANDDADISEAMEIAKLGVINNEAVLKHTGDEWKSYGDSVDIAFLALGEKLNIDTYYTELKKVPYESEKKYSAVFYKEDNITYCTVKGSLEKVLSFCDSMIIEGEEKPLDINEINKQNEELAKDGFRVIALAKSKKIKKVPMKDEIEDEDIPVLSFIGLVGFIDPIRLEAVDAVKACKKAGIKVVMITGDHPLTAFAIARNLGLTENEKEVTTGEELAKYIENEAELDKFVKNKKVFTRVTPLQKLAIINSYKRQGEFVAVTGDGVNDAPAIKSANIGVAMGSGTDVAKEASNMIVIDDNFDSIVKGIEEGRNAYSNIRKVAYFLLSCGISEVLFFTLSIIFNMDAPLVAIQLLWLNLVTDGLQDIALSFEKEEESVMEDKPRNPKESVFNRLMLEEVLLSGITIGLIVFITWIVLINNNVEINKARGYIMTLMVFIQNVHVLNCRSEKLSIFKVRENKNYFVIFSILSAIFLQIFVLYVPFFRGVLKIDSIDFMGIVYMFLLSLPIILLMEVFKIIRNKEKK
jgi:calcium-translocating P-type ATPase